MHPASDDLRNNDQANEQTNERENTAWRQKRLRETARRTRIQKPAAARRNGIGATSRHTRATQD